MVVGSFIGSFTYSMNEGIWCVYYYILFVCLMLMWRPSENAAAYAYHNELATDIQEGVSDIEEEK